MHKALQKALMNTQYRKTLVKKNKKQYYTIQLFHSKAAPFEFQV